MKERGIGEGWIEYRGMKEIEIGEEWIEMNFIIGMKERNGRGMNLIKRDENDEYESDELNKNGWKRGIGEEWIE